MLAQPRLQMSTSSVTERDMFSRFISQKRCKVATRCEFYFTKAFDKTLFAAPAEKCLVSSTRLDFLGSCILKRRYFVNNLAFCLPEQSDQFQLCAIHSTN
jgi:hypothetical protein